MKSSYLKLSLAVAASITLAACANHPKEASSFESASPTYSASGCTVGASAYIYGGRTLLKFEREPYFVSVTDAAGDDVAFEKIGHYYRLEKNLHAFTVRTNLIHITHFTFARAKPAGPKTRMNAHRVDIIEGHP